MGLTVDGAVGTRTLEELNVSLTDRILQLRVNSARGRVQLHDLRPQFVVVNVAAYRGYVVPNDEVIWRARAGRHAASRTPISRSAINCLVWNPSWTVPPGIFRRDILPDARRDPRSITHRGLPVLDRSGKADDPAAIDSQYRSGHIPYTLRQAHGCVRVERPFELATLLLNDSERWNEATIAQTIASGRTQNVTLRNEVPVLLAYWTARLDAGRTRPHW